MMGDGRKRQEIEIGYHTLTIKMPDFFWRGRGVTECGIIVCAGARESDDLTTLPPVSRLLVRVFASGFFLFIFFAAKENTHAKGRNDLQ